MADNFLEKRMDDYRAGRLVRPVQKSRQLASGSSSPGLFVPFPPMKILVVSRSLSELALTTAQIAVSVGAKVALLSDDRKNGTSAAQRLGLRFYPSLPLESVMSDLASRWGGTDVVLTEEELEPGNVRCLELRNLGGDPEDMARFYVFLAHPSNSFFTMS